MGYVSKGKPIDNAKCPYYSTEFKRAITCQDENDNKTVTFKFDTDEQKHKYLLEHCFCYPNECILAKAYDKRYE